MNPNENQKLQPTPGDLPPTYNEAIHSKATPYPVGSSTSFPQPTAPPGFDSGAPISQPPYMPTAAPIPPVVPMVDPYQNIGFVSPPVQPPIQQQPTSFPPYAQAEPVAAPVQYIVLENDGKCNRQHGDDDACCGCSRNDCDNLLCCMVGCQCLLECCRCIFAIAGAND